MPCLFSLLSKVVGLLLGAWLLMAGWFVPMAAIAQGIESVLAPGPLIHGHIKQENDCKQCHIKFDRKGQSGLCADCHKAVGADIKAKTGYHGRLKPQACSSCHTDHKGRDAQVVTLDTKKFDHTQTDFQLKGKHQPVACKECHVVGKKYREASLKCDSCHKKDDPHNGSLGANCAECHSESSWKEAKFDHSTTKFGLEGKHADAKCADCHKGGNYKETPHACVGCHRKDDDSTKGHKGRYGEKCETCHSVKAWKPSLFNHNVDTKFMLRGKHQTANCTSCHKDPLYKTKLGQECYACHAKEDKHKETLGKDCVSCHSERSWKEPAKFDHEKSSFPLLGKHAKVECKECHKSPLFKEAPKECIGCHKQDDKHNANLGTGCADCHSETDWKSTKWRFNHDKTRFLLRNAHAETKVKCVACHKDLQSFRRTPLDCVSCHVKVDKHEGQLGNRCESCHSDSSWKVSQFNHALSRFPLTGKHLVATCVSCHLTPRFKDAARDCYACHKKADQHKLRFGVACESCHNTRSWKLWTFEHGKQTKYMLEGAHLKVACERCHQQEAPSGKLAAPVGSSCLGCHQPEDVHEGQFGVRCEQCHVTESWKKFQRRLSSN